MSAISNDVTSAIPTSQTITGAPETPKQQEEAALFGGSGTLSAGESPEQLADSTLVDLSSASTSTLSSQLSAGVPPDLAAASQLVTQLSAQIGAQGSYAATAQGLLSASATYALIKS